MLVVGSMEEGAVAGLKVVVAAVVEAEVTAADADAAGWTEPVSAAG